MAHTRRSVLRTSGVVLAGGFAGCTGGGAQSAQERYPDYEWSKLDDANPVATTTIETSGFEFHPLIATFEPGSEVTVTNEDSADHTFTVPKPRLDETVVAGASVSVTVERAGTFDYVCTFHPPGMLGRLVVTENPPTATATPRRTETPTPTPGGYGDDGSY